MEKLIELRIAYECAVNYDHVPNREEADELINEILPKYIKVTKKELELILDKYEGNSDSNIIHYILNAIDELHERH